MRSRGSSCIGVLGRRTSESVLLTKQSFSDSPKLRAATHSLEVQYQVERQSRERPELLVFAVSSPSIKVDDVCGHARHRLPVPSSP